MRIAYLTNQYPHVRHTFIRREIVALEGHGVEVVRFSIRDSGSEAVDPADKLEYAKTRSLLAGGKLVLLLAFIAHALTRPMRFLRALREAIRFGRRSERGVLRHLVYLAEACRLRRWLASEHVDHLHVHFATNPAAVARFCQSLGGPTYSITVHGPEEWDQPEALSLRDKYEAAAFVVAVSDFGRCQVFRWTSLSTWPKVHVVRCGVDDAFLNAEPQPVPNTNQLVLVAGLVEQKGHLLLIQALARVRAAGVPFQVLFVGDGHLRPTLENQVKTLGLDGSVTFAGWQTNAEVRAHLLASRALIMPSFAENLPVAMMEALAIGRPVLGTYIAGVPELVEAGINGWLVPAGNVEATAAAIIQILQMSVDDLTRMGRAGADRVRTLHNARNEAQRLKQLFADHLRLQTEG
ncbi:MAG TPA: glycosyltransferase [Gemmataceae bacterium]|jgi:glycosyltransferase involved in cell wall biosynthesis|nr:glycosyltransferase [Gemmataceae bacterium]